jgi:hypothetical protein
MFFRLFQIWWVFTRRYYESCNFPKSWPEQRIALENWEEEDRALDSHYGEKHFICFNIAENRKFCNCVRLKPRSSLFCDVKQRISVVGNRRSGTTCRPPSSRTAQSKKNYSWRREMGCPETSVTNHQTTLRNIPEERRSHSHYVGNLKSRKNKTVYGHVSYETTS